MFAAIMNCDYPAHLSMFLAAVCLLLAPTTKAISHESLRISWLTPAEYILEGDELASSDDTSPDLPPDNNGVVGQGPTFPASTSGATGNESAPDASTIEDRLGELESEIAKLTAAAEKPKSEYPGDPTANFTMELQADGYTFAQDEANLATVGNIPEGTAFRRARVGWFGEWQLTEYRIEFDIAQAGRPTFLDVWAGLKDVPGVGAARVGHFFEPFSLDRLTSNRFGTFLERSSLDSFFVPARNLGFAVYNYSENERATWAVGVFAPNSDNFGDDVGFNRGEALTGRLTCLPYWSDSGRHYFHLGGAGSLRNPDDDQTRFATQPEARLGAATPNVPFFVDTGTLDAEGEMRGGLEAAWTYGPLSIQSEYMCSSVDRIGAADVFFSGVYVQSSLFLTGEHRPYERTSGTFGRVIPWRNFCLASRGPRGCGWGAWEIAGRVSFLDANDADVQGRELTDVTVGLNWYMTPYLRLMSDYIHAVLDDPILGESDADILGFRVSYDF